MTVRSFRPPARLAFLSILPAAVLVCGPGGARASQNADIVLGKDTLACSDHFSDRVVQEPFRIHTDANGWQHCISLALPAPAVARSGPVSGPSAVSAESAAAPSSAETGSAAGAAGASTLAAPHP